MYLRKKHKPASSVRSTLRAWGHSPAVQASAVEACRYRQAPAAGRKHSHLGRGEHRRGPNWSPNQHLGAEEKWFQVDSDDTNMHKHIDVSCDTTMPREIVLLPRGPANFRNMNTVAQSGVKRSERPKNHMFSRDRWILHIHRTIMTGKRQVAEPMLLQPVTVARYCADMPFGVMA